jgi:general nucleoside transport system permease protein
LSEEPRTQTVSRGRRIARTMLVPVLALITALAIGGIVMVFSDPETLRTWASFTRNPGRALSESWNLVYDAYSALFRSSLGSPRALSETIVQATPLMLAGLAVALAFKAGLFNIGAEGQIIAGAMFAGYVGFTFDLPAVIHLPLALLAAFVGGALWGGIVGVLKARTGAHEVITTIMLNAIAVRFLDYFLLTDAFLRPGRTDPISKPVASSAELPGLAGDLRIHAGIIIALLAAAAVWWLLFRSTIGFRFRAVGASPSAAAYAGMSVGGTYILAMLLSGGLAGLGGASTLLGVRFSLTPGFASGFGFDAIALALLGRTHPFGVVAASLLFGILRAGATGMQAATSTPVDIIVVIQALVIAFMAAPALVRGIYRIKAERVGDAEIFTKSWAT